MSSSCDPAGSYNAASLKCARSSSRLWNHRPDNYRHPSSKVSVHNRRAVVLCSNRTSDRAFDQPANRISDPSSAATLFFTVQSNCINEAVFQNSSSSRMPASVATAFAYSVGLRRSFLSSLLIISSGRRSSRKVPCSSASPSQLELNR